MSRDNRRRWDAAIVSIIDSPRTLDCIPLSFTLIHENSKGLRMGTRALCQWLRKYVRGAKYSQSIENRVKIADKRRKMWLCIGAKGHVWGKRVLRQNWAVYWWEDGYYAGMCIILIHFWKKWEKYCRKAASRTFPGVLPAVSMPPTRTLSTVSARERSAITEWR